MEARPVHVVASVTLYALLVQPRAEAPGPVKVVGFGDPDYVTEAAGGVPWPLRGDAGSALAPLPRTREELESLRQLAPDTAQVWTGADATEERASAVGRDVAVLHFACHGLFDDRFPLESGLALSVPDPAEPGVENGLLQAWEVFEEVRLDADLVTLSACETAQGRETPGEGMLGLLWAFQYAGARSILASLWEVDDSSTSELMRSFYRHLRRGEAASEALRRAQLELPRRPDRAAPYYWAAFPLTGDRQPPARPPAPSPGSPP